VTESQSNLLGVYLFAKDLDATLAFYEMLGLPIEKVSDSYARSTMPNGATIGFGTAELTRSYDPHWQVPTGPGTNTINFELSSREAVDATYERLVAAGYRGHLSPCDPPWQARFAIVDDPDGNVIGLHSPRDLQADREREKG
jgi:catechol 2,3-dioxygenase-like lactoylglutathione lyase family enzyme